MAMTQDELEALAAKLGQALLARRWMLTTAESCTGGWAAQSMTAIAGSSEWFERGFVTYSNEAKMEMLGVRAETLATFGAVSVETAAEMAQGALAHSSAQAACAITGIAGPGGGSPDKPVGTVCFAWVTRDSEVATEKVCFAGDRRDVRALSIEHSFDGLLALMT